MKISDLITVDMTNKSESTALRNDFSNPTAAVIWLVSGTGTNSTKWEPVQEVSEDWDYKGLTRLSKVFFGNGGINLLVKRIFIDGGTVETSMKDAINGTDTAEALPSDVINIILAGEDSKVASAANTLAEAVNGKKGQERMVLINIMKSELSTITKSDNLVVNVYDTVLSSGEPATANDNNYEVALVAAYVSKLNYQNSTIKGLEYTVFNGNKDDLNGMVNLPSADFGVNIITELVNRHMLIGGVTASEDKGTPYIAKYFSIILSQRISNALVKLLVNKLNFENSTYSKIANTLTAELDLFINNKLLNTEFEVEENEKVVIETAAGENIYPTIHQGEVLSSGYRVFTLPPSLKDLAKKTYSGIYVYYAINNQIRTIHVNGLVLGGM